MSEIRILVVRWITLSAKSTSAQPLLKTWHTPVPFAIEPKGATLVRSPRTGQFTRLFNPRCDRWAEHFSLASIIIEPLTAIGEVTVSVLRLNEVDRVLERKTLLRLGRYPSREAFVLLGTKT
ncbi:MAG: hypothetical protein WD872_02040 [Pirellulaceae bacterium]